MAVRHVPHFVAEDSGDLIRSQRLDEGVGKKDVAEDGKNPGDASVDHQMAGIPDQQIIEAEAHPPGHTLEPLAKRPFRQAPGGPCQADEERRSGQHQQAQRSQLQRLGGRGPMPLGPEPGDQVLPEHEDQHDRQDQADRLPRLESQVEREPRVAANVMEARSAK